WFFKSRPLLLEDREASKRAFLEAIRLDAGHWLAWKWKTYLAMMLWDSAKMTPTETTRVADAFRLYREAEVGLAARELAAREAGGDLAVEDQAYKGFIEKYRTGLEDASLKLLTNQVNDRAQADNPDRPRWQLALAEMLALRRANLAMARQVLADA